MRYCTLALPVVLLLLPATFAQRHATTPAPTRRAQDTDLPVTHVSLYKNGVGFFEHTGHVIGDAAVSLSFTSAQLNDVLQSLTAIDLNGGRISGAGYNSTTPLDQQLKNLSLSLDADPTQADFYAAIRGARVEVHSGAASITGRLLTMETHSTQPSDCTTTKTPVERNFLTVVSDTGEVRTLELTPATSVRLLDTLHTDVNQYLQLLDSNRNQGLRHLTLNDNGTGTRELHLSYISEVPIWKSTYRILLTRAGTSSTTQFATLQGWSVVDNTTGADWINVHLSLIAGAPQSFIQPLSQPIYSRRPEIPIAQEAQLTPQTFDSSVEMKDRIVPSTAGVAGMSGMAGGAPGGVFGGTLGKSIKMIKEDGPPPSSPISVSYEDAAQTSTAPNTSTAGFDDFFAYNLSEPVTIRQNESALVPIIQTKVDADRVTLVSSDGYSTAQPLRALWITNSSRLTLDRGSFSIIEDGNFGGEGLLDPIHPGEKRLLSYAADQAIHATVEGNRSTQHLAHISAAKGVLKLTRAEFHEVTYVVHNAAADPRTVVLEEPVVTGYILDSETPGSTDPKPAETTPTVYRYRLAVPPGDTVRLHTAATRHGVTTYSLTNSDENLFAAILNETQDNPTLKTALQPILDARRRVADAQTAVTQTNARLNGLRSDEERQRANITALKDADKGSRDRFVNDLNKTEDAVNAAQTDLATRTSTLDAAKADLANRIESLQIDETV
jgi:hypothetical protein